MELPHQNTTNTQRGRFPNSFVGESLSIIQFLLVFCLVADQCLYPHTEITHTIVSSINKYCQQKLVKRHHNPTIYTLEYTYSNT